MKERFYRVCALLLLPFMMALNCPVSVSAASSPAPEIDITIKHNPVTEAKAGKRITVDAEVEATSGVDVVRVYFKAIGGGDYVFVPMALKEGFLDKLGAGLYSGTLPAPANGASGMEYLILVKNSNNQVVKSQTYRVVVSDEEDAAQVVMDNDPIQVYTELQGAHEQRTGFADNITVDVVESAYKYGVVAGIYDAEKAGVAAGEVVAAGTVVATTGIMTKNMLIGGAAALVAVVGVAAIGSSGGSDGGSSGSSTATTSSSGSCPYVGTWSGTYSWSTCTGTYVSGLNWQGRVNSSCYFSGFDGGGSMGGQVNTSTGVVSLSGATNLCGSLTGTATFSGNSVSGSFSGSGQSGSFSGSR